MDTRQKLIILIADDDADDVLLLKRAFIKSGLNVPLHFVTDGQEAIDYLSGESAFANRQDHPMPTLVLLDIKMPRLNGFDVLKWVRKQRGLRRLPILVLTSSDLDTDVGRAYDLGANSYLVKPSDLDDLGELARDVERYWRRRNRSPVISV
jgi:CheY-like chemotaxis protein